MSLTFEAFMKAVHDRAIEFNQGQDIDRGVDFALKELYGELGELCDNLKKRDRAKWGMVGGVVDDENLEDELGDVQIAVALLARAINRELGNGNNLEQVTVNKFNKTSDKHRFSTRLSQASKNADFQTIREIGYRDGYTAFIRGEELKDAMRDLEGENDEYIKCFRHAFLTANEELYCAVHDELDNGYPAEVALNHFKHKIQEHEERYRD